MRVLQLKSPDFTPERQPVRTPPFLKGPAFIELFGLAYDFEQTVT